MMAVNLPPESLHVNFRLSTSDMLQFLRNCLRMRHHSQVTLRWARLVLGSVTVGRQVDHLGMWPVTQVNSAFHPSEGTLNEYQWKLGCNALAPHPWSGSVNWCLAEGEGRESIATLWALRHRKNLTNHHPTSQLDSAECQISAQDRWQSPSLALSLNSPQ